MPVRPVGVVWWYGRVIEWVFGRATRRASVAQSTKGGIRSKTALAEFARIEAGAARAVATTKQVGGGSEIAEAEVLKNLEVVEARKTKFGHGLQTAVNNFLSFISNASTCTLSDITGAGVSP